MFYKPLCKIISISSQFLYNSIHIKEYLVAWKILPYIIFFPPLVIKVDDFVWKPNILDVRRMMSNLLKHSSSRQRETTCLPFLLPTVPLPLFYWFPDQQLLHNRSIISINRNLYEIIMLKMPTFFLIRMVVFHEYDVVGFICVRNKFDTSGIHDVKQCLFNQIQILAN